ncbi:MAG: hypothetical protein KBC38_03885 [Candidatus Pacebacteria bacterium]|nr:hypothetical protein [Candidatus Paceibacterota bacterium]MBP9840693.1 hypothetical protein [Candidatus Paceibacterota bacterium]
MQAHAYLIPLFAVIGLLVLTWYMLSVPVIVDSAHSSHAPLSAMALEAR